MTVDLSQFHQVFFEESFEGLEAMETALMELNPEAIDSETINTIFRSAHSIKGGAATFGLTVVAEFTHVLETLLDEVRSGLRAISQDDIDLFLQSVDCLRQLLTDLQQNVAPDTEQSQSLIKAFEAILARDPAKTSEAQPSDKTADVNEQPSTTASVQTAKTVTDAGSGYLNIRFVPGRDVLRTGNEPLRIFRELQELVPISVTASLESLPSFSELDPESCYLSFDIRCQSNVEESAVREVFEWVSDESEIHYETVSVGSEEVVGEGWSIQFSPGQDILKTGNDPIRLFRDLEELGALSVQTSLEGLPDWGAFDPECCYLSWALTLAGKIDQADLDSTFEWVIDDSNIQYLPLGNMDNASSDTSADVGASASSDKGFDADTLEETEKSQDSQGAQESDKTDVSEIKGSPSAPSKVATTRETTSIRVDIDKVDALINMVGELVITQSMLGQLGKDFDISNLTKLLEGLTQLEHNTRELQESVMRIRMLPISVAFNRFPRMVRDLSRRLNKKIELKMIGEQTELDKTVMEKIGDPLVHLVRNALDHGIELPEERIKKGKSDTGLVTLNAYHQSGNVIIEITDDGKGLDRHVLSKKAIEKGLISERDAKDMSDSQVYDLIFQPGFSTASQVSDVSGRGVGMDVVRRNIQALNGSVEISSTLGFGSKITIRLPLTLAILDGQLVRIGEQIFIFPLVSIVESLESSDDMVNKVASGCNVFQLRNEYVPIIRLYEIFNLKSECQSLDDALLVVVENDGEKVAIHVDELLAQQQVVIKSLEQNYQRVEGVSGATILGDGTVALILDIPGLVRLAGINQRYHSSAMSLSQSLGAVQQLH